MSNEQRRRDHFYFTPEEIRASAEAALKASNSSQRSRPKRRLPLHQTQLQQPPEPQQPEEFTRYEPETKLESEPQVEQGMLFFIELVSAINTAPTSVLERAKQLIEAVEMYMEKPNFNGVQQQMLESFYIRPFMPELLPFIDLLTESVLLEKRVDEKKRQKLLQVVAAIKTLLALQEFSRSHHE